MSIVFQRAAKASGAAIWSALTLIPLCAHATEFGGVVDASPNPGFVALCHQLQTDGNLTWLRSSSPDLARQGFNEVAIVPLPASVGQQPRSQKLSPDLLAVYWECRTNLPVFPNVQQAWEVGNEPDFVFVDDNPDRMAAVVKAAYWGIKAGNPRAVVLLPSLAFVPDKYPRELAANGLYPFIDGYNFHFYGWAQDFLPSLKLHRQFLARQHWNLPIWITEAGYFQMRQERSGEPEDLARQQTFHERLALTASAAGVDFYLPFILTPYSEEGCDLGLVTSNFVVRPALESYLFLSRHLHGSRAVYQVLHRSTQSEIGVVLAEPDGNWLTALWTPYRWKDLGLPAHDPALTRPSATLSHPMGEGRGEGPSGGMAELPVGSAAPGAWSRPRNRSHGAGIGIPVSAGDAVGGHRVTRGFETHESADGQLRGECGTEFVFANAAASV